MKTRISFRLKSSGQAGFSIPEAVFALGIGALAVTGGMAMNQEQLRMVKSTRESSGASSTLEERVEQLRLANWRQITDATYLQTTYFATKPKSSLALAGMTEHITITAFPNESACTPLELERSPDGTIRMIQDGTGLGDQRLAKVDVGVTWSGKGSRTRTRELATVISNAGISRMNLPSMGAGSTASTSTTDTTTSSGSTTTTTTTTTTDTTTTSTGNNGNGNGRGNVGGKSGKA